MKQNFVSWNGVNNALDFLAIRIRNEIGTGPVYGIPRGGQVVAGLLQKHGIEIADEPEQAKGLVDDVVDSGKTAKRWADEYKLMVYALVEEKKPGQSWIVFPWETKDEEEPEDAARRLLIQLNLNVKAPGLVDTPRRMVELLDTMTSGYSEHVNKILGRTFEDDSDEIIVVRGIPFWSLCEHHMMPFHGHVSVGYLPQDRVLGLSKIPRLVKAFARRPQLQERMTAQIADAMMKARPLKPRGVGVLVTASHSCMAMRGIESDGEMVTSSVLGMFRENAKVKAEWLQLVR